MGMDIHLRVQVQHGGRWQERAWPEDLTLPRNSLTFAALADVQNARGIPPIAPPRGLPADLVEAGERDPAATSSHFSHTTWLLLTELQAYAWEGSAWQATFQSFGETYPLHAYTREFRETVMPALARLGPPHHVRIVLTFSR